ncbi:MAG: hypothetical protein OEP45_04645 [Acidobacteriota bacterium]|nr:hypothetical protein [Acidobacteriota bacterium]
MRRLIVLGHCLLTAAAGAQTPVGAPFPINELTPGAQIGADAARQPNRSFVVVWQSDAADGDGTAVRARLFSARGNPISSEFTVNETTVGNQWRPRVATDALGNFVVVWIGPDQQDHAVFARLFAADGAPLGREFQVNSQTPLVQPWVAVGRNGSGDFLVSWAARLSSEDVKAAAFDASGAVALPEFVVNTSGNYPSGGGVASGMRSDGGFVVAWVGEHDAGGPGPTTDVFQRRFAADGSPLSGEFQLSDPGEGGAYYSIRPDVGVDESDNFLVVWHTQLNLAWGGVYGRRTDAGGATGPIKELAIESEDHTFSMAPTGDFVVVWHDYYPYGGEPRGDRFDPLGNHVATFAVPDTEDFSTLVHSSDNPSDFVLVRLVGPDWDLVGQRFGDVVFADGFESGDTSAWSGSTGELAVSLTVASPLGSDTAGSSVPAPHPSGPFCPWRREAPW